MTDSPPQLPSPGRKVYLRIRSNATIVLCILACLLVLLVTRSPGRDFQAFFVAGQSAVAHLDPYSDNSRYGELFTDYANENSMSRWIYPPAALFGAAPLAWHSLPISRLLFGLVSICSLIWVLLFLGRKFELGTVWLAFACICIPVVACVHRGQVDLLILFFVVLAYRYSSRFWAGVPLGIAISIKIFPAALLLWWLLEKKFKEAATAIAFAVLLGLLALWRFGPASYHGFLHNLTTLHSRAAIQSYGENYAIPLINGLSIPHLPNPWLSFCPGFVGSYNNPLIHLNDAGIVIGFLLTVAGIFYLRYKRVATEIGFFGTVILSQLMNTTLWTMGMVMYLPICLVAISRLRSNVAAILFLLPLYLPSQIRIFGSTPRFVIALVLIFWLVIVTSGEDKAVAEKPDRAEHLIRS